MRCCERGKVAQMKRRFRVLALSGMAKRWKSDRYDDWGVCFEEGRFAEAYLTMFALGYRPAAPSDGYGNVCLTKKQLGDEVLLRREALKYAVQLRREADTNKYHIGCANGIVARAFALALEGARGFCCGCDERRDYSHAIVLLEAAIKEAKAVKRHQPWVRPECVVYWLHDENQTNPTTDGYVGITWRLEERLKAHRIAFPLWRGVDHFEVTILFRGNEEQCLAIEEELRPKPFIGWNIARGGNARE
jgi:hypothetical protein